MKKIFSLILFAFLAVACAVGVGFILSPSENIEEEDKPVSSKTYVIDSESQWYDGWGDGGFSEIYLNCDISIGSAGIFLRNCIFYGGGHTITSSGPLFAGGEDSEVWDLNVNADLSMANVEYEGGIFTWAVNCNIYNCSINVDWALTYGVNKIGGIFGTATACYAENCYVYYNEQSTDGYDMNMVYEDDIFSIIDHYYGFAACNDSSDFYECYCEPSDLAYTWEPTIIPVVLDANGGKIYSYTEYTVYYDFDNGEFDFGDVYMPTPTRFAHTFLYWAVVITNSSGVTNTYRIYDTTSVTYYGFNKYKENRLYAQWEENTFDLTYNSNGGTIAASSNWTGSGETVTVQITGDDSRYEYMPIPTKSGYVFGGWYTTSSFGTRVYRDTYVTVTNVYAKWVTCAWGGAGTSASPYTIATFADLQCLEYAVNAGNSYSGKYFKQTADITLSNTNRAMIGWYACYDGTSRPFSGTYDGNWFEINYIYARSIFYSVSGGTIKNLGVKSSISSGGSAALAETIVNSTITGCWSTGSVSGSSRAAGLVGSASQNSTISCCYNTATITSSGALQAAGIVGYITSGTVTNCYNTGKISGASEGSGGIVGYSLPNTTFGAVTISNCYNYGSVSGYAAGGIVGLASATNYKTNIQNSYNVGAVSTTNSSSGSAGGISATGGSALLSNCYYGGSCTLTVAIGGSAQSNTGATKSTTLATDAKSTSWSLYTNYWDFTNIWTIMSDMNNGYPIFRSQLEEVLIIFNPNEGGGTVASISAYVGQTINLPSNTFTRVGFTSNGWNDETSLRTTPNYANGASYKVTGPKTFYANWKPKPKDVTLSFKFDESGTWTTTAPQTGFSYKATYLTTTLSGTGTTTATATVSSATTKTMRAGQNISIDNITCPAGWACVGYASDTATPPSTTSSPVASLAPYLADNTTATTIYVCFRYVGLELKYDNQLKYFYFEDGEMPQTAVSTYNTSFNTLLTNVYSSSTGSSFSSNGITFMIQTYTYISGQDSAFSSYSGQRFMGFVMPTTRTVKLQNSTSSTLSYTSYTFTAGTTYWFRFDPIRWRVSDYGVESTNPPSAWDLVGETTTNTKVVSDILWWDVIESSSKVTQATYASSTYLFEKIEDGALTGESNYGCDFATSVTYSYDKKNNASVSNDKVAYQIAHFMVVFAGLDEIEANQSELNSYASQLVCVLAGKNQDQFVEYWTRDFGQQPANSSYADGCGTYVTKSGETVTSSYWTVAKGARFATCLSRVGNSDY